MQTGHRFGVAVALVALSALASALAWPDLPAEMATHWNAEGEVDDTMSRAAGAALLPALSAAMVALFAVLPRVDPLGENVANFRAEYDWFVVALTAFLALVHGGILWFNLGNAFEFQLLVLAGAAGLLVYSGHLVRVADRNWFVGIRTPWTLSSEAVWDRTHAVGGRLLQAAGVLGLVGLAFGDLAVYFLAVPVAAVALFTTVYSYWLYRDLEAEPDLAGD